ncbi:MAG: hypothetical protein QOH97_5588 [Actinoplanes sp.]|jgi:hypothetical protein|nr:hypothetical protein [Actinoplanes sp.]
MVVRRAVSFKVSGPIDQPTLDGLREQLRLKPEGRISDDWDQIFGERVAHTDYGQVEIQLARDDDSHPPIWNVDLLVDDGSRVALSVVEQEISAAIVACGLAVTEIFRASVPN